jgi:hypothetical protein
MHCSNNLTRKSCCSVAGEIISGRIYGLKAIRIVCLQLLFRRMVSSGMLRRVALVRTDVLEEHSASFIRVTRIGEQGTMLAVTSNRRCMRWLLVTASIVPSSPALVTLMKEALSSSKMSVLTRATRCNIPEEDAILHSHSRENLKSYNCCFNHLSSFTTVNVALNHPNHEQRTKQEQRV